MQPGLSTLFGHDQALDPPPRDLHGPDAAPRPPCTPRSTWSPRRASPCMSPDEVSSSRQGERAQFVFNLTSGPRRRARRRRARGDHQSRRDLRRHGGADARGSQRHGAGAQRAAAWSRCPRSQFTDLIRSNPATIHALLTDMANSIVSLNEQLVQARLRCGRRRRDALIGRVSRGRHRKTRLREPGRAAHRPCSPGRSLVSRNTENHPPRDPALRCRFDVKKSKTMHGMTRAKQHRRQRR
jgi:hypothetical protein